MVYNWRYKGGEFYQINHESNKISAVDISVPEQGINVSTEGRGGGRGERGVVISVMAGINSQGEHHFNDITTRTNVKAPRSRGS